MRYVPIPGIAGLFLLAAALTAMAAEEKPLKQTFDELLPKMGAESNYEQAQQEWQNLCFRLGAPGQEAQRVEACKLMAEKLGPATAKTARIWLLVQLQRIGHGECVEAVAAALDDADELVRETARRALTANPAPEANVRLLTKLAGVKDAKFKVALINALGERADKASVAALAKELDKQETAVAAAAARALGKIATAEAAAALAAARPHAQGEVRLRIGESRLLCAEKLLKEGKANEAVVLYRHLRNSANVARSIPLAALAGLFASSDAWAKQVGVDDKFLGKTLAEFIARSDAGERAIAIASVANVRSGAVEELSSRLAELPPIGQVVTLDALAARGDKIAMPAAVAAAKSEDENVKLAGLRALGSLGDATAVPLLLESLVAGGVAAGAARSSLERIYGAGVDENLIDAMRNTREPGQRGALIEILERRGAVEAVPALLQQALGENAEVRRRAMAALGKLGDPKDVPQMVKGLLKAEKGGERDDAEKAITAVCNRVADDQQRADPVLAVMAGAGEADKVAVLPVLGRIGAKKALAAIKSALAGPNADAYDAGVRGLCNWPDASVSESLLELAQSGKEKGHRIAALRAVVRVIALSADRGDRANPEKLVLLQKAMQLCSRDEERDLILERAAAVRLIGTLRFVAPYLDNKDLAQRACRTVVDLAHHRELREPNKAEFEAPLKKVIEISKDRGLVERANRYLQGLP